MDQIYAAYDPERDGLQRRKERNIASNLVAKDPFFESIFLLDPIYQLAGGLLGHDCILSCLLSGEPVEGQGMQCLHRDTEMAAWKDPETSPPEGIPIVMNSFWALDDMDRDNGATRLIPGSHKTKGDPSPADEKNVIYSEVPAGSVLVIDGHLVHGGSLNRSGRRRRALISCYSRKGFSQYINQKTYLPSQIQARLSARARNVLGLED